MALYILTVGFIVTVNWGLSGWEVCNPEENYFIGFQITIKPTQTMESVHNGLNAQLASESC